MSYLIAYIGLGLGCLFLGYQIKKHNLYRLLSQQSKEMDYNKELQIELSSAVGKSLILLGAIPLAMIPIHIAGSFFINMTLLNSMTVGLLMAAIGIWLIYYFNKVNQIRKKL